jgi:ribosomal protein L34E
MPTRMLRFCRKCLVTRQTLSGEMCHACDSELLPFLDEHGAISREFLAARGNCCSSGCRNCPYPAGDQTNTRQPASFEHKSCQRCGSGFDCLSENCWCGKLQLAPKTLEWLERNYAGCLCPACLAEFTAVAWASRPC